MELGLLFRALARHKAIVAVLILEFAVTLAILSNALSLATARVRVLQTPSGAQESGLIIATPMTVGATSSNLDGATYEALRLLVVGQPGVRSVSMIGQAPLSGADRWSGIVAMGSGRAGHPIDVAIYTGDEWMPATLGLTLASGRWFTKEEVLPVTQYPDTSQVHIVQLTEALARKLFKGLNPVGRTMYFNNNQVTVIGVLRSLSRPAYHGGPQDQDSVIIPIKPALMMQPALAIRLSDNSNRARTLAVKTLRDVLDRRTQGSARWMTQSYEDIRDSVFIADRAALWLLGAILVAVIGVAANGIAASSSSWVSQRTRQTWIRRAVGATRAHVISYFLAENAIIGMLGVALGVGLGLAVNLVLVDYLSVPRMTVQSLYVGAFLALIIGQMAVLRSAIKTAAA